MERKRETEREKERENFKTKKVEIFDYCRVAPYYSKKIYSILILTINNLLQSVNYILCKY
jgi:hypothetical protein